MSRHHLIMSCGHTEYHALFGRRTDRDRRAKWIEKNRVCRECFDRQIADSRESATAEAEKKTAERGLPPLIGTPKQVAWAETIRAEKIEEAEARIDDADPDAYQMLCAKNSAHWWIDNREETGWDLLRAAGREKKSLKQEAADALQRAAEAEATIRPTEAASETVAHISGEGGTIKIYFPEKREDLRELARFGLGFKWTGKTWTRTVPAETTDDAVAAVGRELLRAGFVICVMNPTVREKITNDESPTWKFIVDAGGNHLGLCWLIRDDYIYTAARRLPGAKWRRPCMQVPAEQFADVRDFGEIRGFTLTHSAKKLIRAAEKRAETAIVLAIKPRPVDDDEPERPKLTPENTGEIDADLIDEYPFSAPSCGD